MKCIRRNLINNKKKFLSPFALGFFRIIFYVYLVPDHLTYGIQEKVHLFSVTENIKKSWENLCVHFYFYLVHSRLSILQKIFWSFLDHFTARLTKVKGKMGRIHNLILWLIMLPVIDGTIGKEINKFVVLIEFYFSFGLEVSGHSYC